MEVLAMKFPAKKVDPASAVRKSEVKAAAKKMHEKMMKSSSADPSSAVRKGEKPEGYFLGGVARGLRRAAGGAFGVAGALLGRRRSRPAPTPASPTDPAAIAKFRSRMPGGVSKLVGGFPRRPAAPAPTAAPAAGAANQAAPPTQTPPAFKYGGVVPSKKASMKDREEQKWVKSVQKKAGGGKKGC
jgi:hypothetical protein